MKRWFALTSLCGVLFLTLIFIQPQVILALQSYVISGQITQDNGRSGVDGITIVCADGINTPITTTSTGGGYYNCTVGTGWSGTVTPLSTEYTFSPVSSTITTISADITRDFGATLIPIPPPEQVAISGLINYCSFQFSGICYVYSPLSDVLLTYPGGSTVSNASGLYSFSVPSGWSGEVTPIKIGYVFSPTLISYNTVITHQTNQTYTGEASTQTYAISGVITDATTLSGVDGVIITFSDGVTTVTSGGGFYARTVSVNWRGTLFPAQLGYAFSPTVTSINQVLTNTVQNFVRSTSVQSYTIWGTVNLGSGAREGLGGVAIIFDNGSVTETITTSGGGSYSHTVTAGWYGTVTPDKTGYALTPSAPIIGPVYTNTLQNFTANIAQLTISGNTTAGNATLTYSPGGSITSDVAGNYAFAVDYGWTGVVTVNRAGWIFTPTTRSYTNVVSDLPGENYNGSAIPAVYTISGHITDTETMLPAVDVWLDFSDGYTTTTDAAGFYTRTVSINWQGTIEPIQAGYVFSPTTATLPPVATNVTQDFRRSPPASAAYCAASGDTTNDLGIVALTVNTGTQASAITAYSSYTGTALTELLPGETYNYQITYRNDKSTAIQAYGAGYFDFDGNTQFDDGCSLQCGSFSVGAGAVMSTTGSFTVPVTANSGTTHLRMVTNYDSNNIVRAPACDTTLDGEVEDYTVGMGIYQIAADLSKKVAPPGLVGNIITFTINITNTAHTPFITIPMVDNFSDALGYISGTALSPTLSIGRLAWTNLTTATTFGNIAPGQSMTIETVFSVSTITAITNTAVITAQDDMGNVISRSATLQLIPPLADAGIDQTTVGGTAITLDGSASQSFTGQGMRTFRWAQTGGAPVSFTPSLSRTGFIAPTTSGMLTFTLAVTDSYGFPTFITDTTRVNVVDGDVSATVDPATGGNLVFTGTQLGGYITTTLELPGGAVSDTTYLVYTEAVSPTHPAPGAFLFAGRTFTIEAYQGLILQDNFTFHTPITLTLQYPPDALGEAFEAGIELLYWDGSQWTSDGITIIERDFVNHRLVATINHLTEFSLFGLKGYDMYIPLLLK